jgi:site-specific recombinase XerD
MRLRLKKFESQRSYRHSIDEFVAWFCSAPRLPDASKLKGKRDQAILAVLLGCGLRRRELTELTVEHFQQREDHRAIIDLIGKAGHVSRLQFHG